MIRSTREYVNTTVTLHLRDATARKKSLHALRHAAEMYLGQNCTAHGLGLIGEIMRGVFLPRRCPPLYRDSGVKADMEYFDQSNSPKFPEHAIAETASSCP